MNFRVTAIQDEGMPEASNEARLWLEDWLNKSLQDADFGCKNAAIIILISATSSLPSAPPVSRLTTDETGNPILALHISIDPKLVHRTRAASQLHLLCSHIVRGLPARPLRKPRGLDYGRLRQALLACIQPFEQGAA